MNEKRWRSCTDLNQLFAALGKRRRSNLRKNRLFACACCRCVWHLLDEASRVAVALSELYADGLVNAKAMRAARDDVHRAMQAFSVQHGTLEEYTDIEDEGPYTYIVIHDLERRRQAFALNAAHCAAYGSGDSAAWLALEAEARDPNAARAQAELLRDTYGNPFQRFPRTFRTSAAVRDLAEALVGGADCSFALHDALLEMGQPKLAAHFRTGAHSRGCWAADRILGKG